MKKLGIELLLTTLLVFLFVSLSFSKEIKTFDENYICGEQDSDWEEFKKYEESDKPYRILRHDIENNGIYYDYYNCDESDYEEDDEDDDYEDSDYYDDDEDENYNHISNKNNNNISSGNKEVTVDPNVFHGKKKDECPTEEVLYKMAFYLQPFDASHVNDINSGSQYHYDDTKTAYFYPIITEENYISFVAMAQDGVSELNQTIFIIDFCQFNKDEQGNWSLLSKTNFKKREESYKNVPEKDIFDEVFAKAKSDVNMLIKMMNCKTKATQYVSDTYGYKFYTYASMDNVSKFYLTKSENKKVNEQNQKKQYYMQHPSENPTNVGLSNYVFLTGQGESIGQMLKMVYDTIKSMGNNYASYYVIKSYYDSAKSMFSGMLQITASYRMAGENNLTYLQHKQDCTYLNFHFMEISKAYGFVY